MNRHKLSEESFLKHLFSPAKNPLPTGLRRSKLVGTKGRVKGRLASYNRMSAKSQEILRSSGLRDKYLAGEASLGDAKKTLRVKSVEKGWSKPLKPKATPASTHALDTLDKLNAGYIIRTLITAGKEVHQPTVVRNSARLPVGDKLQVRKWDYNRIAAYAASADNNVVIDGKSVNPLWYHS